ncbi:hypothetical protein BDA99DRAFT_272927 [Phascolomyces articulosus]|uniref:Uncharacterized protein n=1 Tax=Phascolomyces articulosus TaxID=60185 RepID=A0AAD5K7J4_9FUNG|nr:hypothetical protein BDA99DRAFT_272927 [Phascolomyces articulosus]
MNHTHVEFVRNNCLDPTGFEPVKFFSHFQFKTSAREFATNVLKEVVESLKNDSDEQIVAWAERFSKYNYQVLETTFIDEYWLSVSARSTETMQRLVTEQQSQYKWSAFTKEKYEATQKKRKTRHHNEQQEAPKTSRIMDLKLLDEISQDKVTVSWTDKSLGNILKEYTKAFVNSQVDQDFHGLIL